MRCSLRWVSAALISTVAAPSAFAAQHFWNNLTGGWGEPAMWSPFDVPPSEPETTLVFGGSGAQTYTATNDLGEFQLNSLVLASTATGPVTLAGAPLRFLSKAGATGGAAPTLMQNGSGNVVVSNGLAVAGLYSLKLGGSGSGQVALAGVVSGGQVVVSSGSWWFQSSSNTFSGGTQPGLQIDTGALLEIGSPGPGDRSVRLEPGTGLLGGGSLTINGGSLKVTTKGSGGEASAITPGGRAITFTAAGGAVDLRNSSSVAGTHGGGIAINNGGDFSALLSSDSSAAVATFRFNGGESGLSSGDAGSAAWNPTGNALRLATIAGSAPLRVELTNGAMFRSQLAFAGANVTIRGVVSGDPTSGPAGVVDTGLSRTTGRMAVDYISAQTYAALRFEGAMQVGAVALARSLNGAITIGGSANGNAGYVAFTGRSTGAQLSSTLDTPGTVSVGQGPLWLLHNGSGSLRVETGGVAVFDARLQSDSARPNSNGVVLDGPLDLAAGATLRVQQSISNFTPGLPNYASNVGDVIIYGDITARGTTSEEAVLSIALPEPQPGATVASGVPATLTAAPTAPGERPYGGLRFDDSRGAADLIINGTGFGGLRVSGVPRVSASLSGGTPDPVAASTKVASMLTAARLARLKGTGGYLTPAPIDSTFVFPVGGEWGSGILVGLRIINNHAGGTDLQFASTSWGHNIVVDDGATVDTGPTPFTHSAGTLIGTGTINAPGGLTVGSAASVAPGFGLGTLHIAGSLSLAGHYLADVAAAGSDHLEVAGNLNLSGPLSLTGSLGTNDLTIASYTGSLTGTFSTINNLDLSSFSIDYGSGANSTIRLRYDSSILIWSGTPGNTWSLGGGNWQSGVFLSATHSVRFDDSASGSTDVVIAGTGVEPGMKVLFENSTKAYTLTSSPGAALGGSAQLVKNGGGQLVLSGPATYSGGTTINAGSVRLGASNSLPDTGAVFVAAGATLATQGFGDTIADLSVNGTVSGNGSLNVASLTVGQGASIASNLILRGNVIKNSAGLGVLTGSLDLGGANRTFTVNGGATSELVVSGTLSGGSLTKDGNGKLAVTGNGPIPLSVTAGTLAATGTFGEVTVSPGSTLAPGNHSRATIQTGNLELHGTLEAEVSKTDFNLPPLPTDFDRIDVTGTVNITNATLTLIPGANVPRGSGDVFTLIANDGADPVVGTFVSLPHGFFSEFQSGMAVFISYQDEASTPALEFSGGNDVSIRLVIPEPAVASLFLASSILLTRRRRAIY